MKRITVLLMLISTSVAIAQAPIILSDRQRKNIIIATDEALDLWAPGYNRHYGQPIIKNETAEEKALRIKSYKYFIKEKKVKSIETFRWTEDVINGREYYIVTYQYDRTVEMFTNPFAAQVYIWRDNNKVFQIVLGSMIVLSNLDKPQTKGKTPIVSPHVPQKPPKKFIIKGTGNEPDTFVITNQY